MNHEINIYIYLYIYIYIYTYIYIYIYIYTNGKKTKNTQTAKLVDNFSHKSDVTSLQDPFTLVKVRCHVPTRPPLLQVQKIPK